MYADETNAIEEEIPGIPRSTLPALGKMTKEDVLQHYANLFEPGRGNPLRTHMHITLDPVLLLYTPQELEFPWQSWKE